MEDLRISVIQTNLYWENPDANLANLEEKIRKMKDTDLIVLPEMFTTGFSNTSILAEMPNMKTYKWLKMMAKSSNAVIMGSVMVKEKDLFYNRLLIMYPNGTYKEYNKKHLFKMALEDATFTAGTENIIVEVKKWKIKPLICYDLRFPIWSRNSLDKQYDILVYVANWPTSRALAWNTLLQARAIENLCYVVACNRIGTDGNNINYQGESQIIDYSGVIKLKSNEEEIISQTINIKELHDFRDKFRFLDDADII